MVYWAMDQGIKNSLTRVGFVHIGSNGYKGAVTIKYAKMRALIIPKLGINRLTQANEYFAF